MSDPQRAHNAHVNTVLADHGQRIGALERERSERLSDTMLLNSFQTQLGEVQRLVREMRFEMDAMRARELAGLDAEAKHLLINELAAVVQDVDALKTALAERAVGEIPDA